MWAGGRHDILLDEAKRIGDSLLQLSVPDGDGRCWPYRDEVSHGLAHGSSGVAMFLAELFRATGDTSYRDAAESGLLHDIAHARETPDGGLSWTYKKGVPSALLPYWQWGSAGVGAAVCRYAGLGCIGEYECADVLARILLDTERKYAVQCGHLMGLSGIGHFLLDAFAVTRDSQFERAAARVADGVRLFAVRRAAAVEWPGSTLLRMSCDFGTGAAGVASFLGRMAKMSSHDSFLPPLRRPSQDVQKTEEVLV